MRGIVGSVVGHLDAGLDVDFDWSAYCAGIL
jgi:hypothetical protein